MNKRTSMQRLYVGDVGVITAPPKAPHAPPPEIDLDALPTRQLLTLAVECGIKVQDLIGIDTCLEHQDMIVLGSKPMPQGFNLFEHCSYCRNCFQMFRTRYK